MTDTGNRIGTLEIPEDDLLTPGGKKLIFQGVVDLRQFRPGDPVGPARDNDLGWVWRLGGDRMVTATWYYFGMVKLLSLAINQTGRKPNAKYVDDVVQTIFPDDVTVLQVLSKAGMFTDMAFVIQSPFPINAGVSMGSILGVESES